MAEKTMFEILAATDCSAHVEKKETGKDKYGNKIELSYLSWAWAWDYFKKALPDAKYEIKHWDGKPYIYDEFLGFMVETSITAGGETHTMWLPVMDGTNSAMKNEPQKFVMKRKDGTTYDKIVAAATMFDINKTIMRCLVKNMAMFGLGLYIYAGEDLPSDPDETIDTPNKSTKHAEPETKSSIEDVIAGMDKMTLDTVKRFYAKAIDLYGKETPEYRQWVAVWKAKKESLEQNSAKDDLKSELDALEQFYG